MEIEKLREKFKDDLVGRWVSELGTFSNIMDEEWLFYSNGSGVIISSSTANGDEIEEFIWRKKSLLCIEISYSEAFEHECVWLETKYDFCKIQTDRGVVTVLVQMDEVTGEFKNGFGLMETPLIYAGEV